MNKQRDYEDNVEHKNKLYLSYDKNVFNNHLQTLEGHQGWRNKLIDAIPNLNKEINFVDIGCGLGDKTLRLLNNEKNKFKNIFLIDYSNQSTVLFSSFYKDDKVKILHEDVMKALDMVDNDSLDLVVAFGFIHEIKNRKSFLLKLKTKLNKNHLLLISDNDLYFSAEKLDLDFKNCGLNSCVYKKILKISNIHIFYRVTKNSNFSKFIISFHKGYSDNIISISNKYVSFFKNI